MDLLIWTGAAISFAGLVGILWSMLQVMKARRAGMADEALRARLQSLVAVNMLAFLISVVGLAMVVVGILLG